MNTPPSTKNKLAFLIDATGKKAFWAACPPGSDRLPASRLTIKWIALGGIVGAMLAALAAIIYSVRVRRHLQDRRKRDLIAETQSGGRRRQKSSRRSALHRKMINQ
jgi:hypothetical protein